MAITEYEVYSDERYEKSRALLGALIVTNKGRERMIKKLGAVRNDYSLSKEMKWGKISNNYLSEYKAWIDIFFTDPYSRFAYMEIDNSTARKRVESFRDFLLNVIGRPSELKGWWVYHDDGFFGRSSDFKKVRAQIDSKYWALYPRHTIRFVTEMDSKREDMIQLVDVILGAVAHQDKELPKSQPRRDFVIHFQEQHRQHLETRKGFPKIARI
jgi:hypothetical protein